MRRANPVALTAIIALAKFVYKNDIGTDDYVDDTDLVIIRRLNQLFNNIIELVKNTPASVPHSEKSIPFKQAIDVLNTLRLKADCLFREGLVQKHNAGVTRIYTYKIKRKESAIANDLQDFLAVAFMVLIPTDRARTYYELSVSKTFVYGFYDGTKFISANKVEDKNQVKWYIHLMPDDYKTGKKYQEYWGKIPNVHFEKGKTLYSYIERWLNKERECEHKCNHNFFFRGSTKYNPLSSTRWSTRIKCIFEPETGVPVTPKEIRKMYITHLYNSKKDDATLKSAAYAMHHSPAMQQNVYNSQTILERLQPIFEYNETMHEEFFGENSQYED